MDQTIAHRSSVFKGLEPYEVEDYLKFGGRRDDVQRLVDSIENKNYTLLYGKSGIGKSSLLKAGIYLELIKHKYFPIHLRFDFAKGSAFTVLNALKKDIFNALSTNFNDVLVPDSKASLLEYVSRLQLQGGLTRPLLIIDQFEELFTLGRKEKSAKEILRIVEELSNLAEDRNNDEFNKFKKRRKFHIIFSMREDYLPLLHNLRAYFTSFNRNLFRLSYMNGLQAIEAIHQTAKASDLTMNEEVVLSIIEQVIDEGDDEFIPAPTKHNDGDTWKKDFEQNWISKGVTPLLLSFYCDRLERMHSANGLEFDILIKQLSLKGMMATHYQETMEKVSPEVRKAVETLLLTRDGHRQRIHANSFLSNFNRYREDINQLRQARIIKVASPDNGAEYIELVHDVLIDIVKEHLDERLQKEQEDAKRLQLEQLEEEHRHEQRKQDEKNQREQELLKKEYRWKERILLERNRRKRIGVWAISALLLFTTLLVLQQFIQKRNEEAMAMAFRSSDLMSLALNYWVNVDPNTALNLGIASKGMAQESRRFNNVDLQQHNTDLANIYSRTRTYKTLEEYDGIVYGLYLSNDQKTILSASEDGHIRATDIRGKRLWDVELPRAYKNRGAPVSALGVSSNEDVFASGTIGGTVYIHDFKSGSILDSFFNPGDWILDIEFIDRDNMLVCRNKDQGDIFAFDLQSEMDTPYLSFEVTKGTSARANAIAYDNTNQLLYSLDIDGLKSWDNDGKFLRKVFSNSTSYDMSDLSISQSGERIFIRI